MEQQIQKTPRLVTVAYADDHKAVRKGIISYLHELGGVQVVIEAEDGQDLIEQLEQNPQQADVCIIDINMPRMNGFETVAAIRKKWRDKKILILSTYDEDMYILRIIRAGANGYLVKACDPEEIKEAILSIHHTGHYYPQLYLEKSIEAFRNEPTARLSNFSEREITFLKYSCSDMTYAQIAQCMECSKKSVEGYRDNLFRKLNINNRVSLAIFALRSGLVLL